MPLTCSSYLLRVSALHYPTEYWKGSEGFGCRLQLVCCANLLLESKHFRYWNQMSEVNLSRSIALTVFERRGQIKARVFLCMELKCGIVGVMFRVTKSSRQ